MLFGLNLPSYSFLYRKQRLFFRRVAWKLNHPLAHEAKHTDENWVHKLLRNVDIGCLQMPWIFIITGLLGSFSWAMYLQMINIAPPLNWDDLA